MSLHLIYEQEKTLTSDNVKYTNREVPQSYENKPVTAAANAYPPHLPAAKSVLRGPGLLERGVGDERKLRSSGGRQPLIRGAHWHVTPVGSRMVAGDKDGVEDEIGIELKHPTYWQRMMWV